MSHRPITALALDEEGPSHPSSKIGPWWRRSRCPCSQERDPAAHTAKQRAPGDIDILDLIERHDRPSPRGRSAHVCAERRPSTTPLAGKSETTADAFIRSSLVHLVTMQPRPLNHSADLCRVLATESMSQQGLACYLHDHNTEQSGGYRGDAPREPQYERSSGASLTFSDARVAVDESRATVERRLQKLIPGRLLHNAEERLLLPESRSHAAHRKGTGRCRHGMTVVIDGATTNDIRGVSKAATLTIQP